MPRISLRAMGRLWPMVAATLLAGCNLAQLPRPEPLSDYALPAHQLSFNPHETDSAQGDHPPQGYYTQLHDASLANARLYDGFCHGKAPALAGLYRAASAPGFPVAASAPVIVLSGGGPHGAFGAGLMLGLHDSGRFPHDPAIVTGVSTGSLQSTFAFLAEQPPVTDRVYDAIPPDAAMLKALPGDGSGQPLQLHTGDNLNDMVLGYAITSEGQIGKANWSGNPDDIKQAAALLTKGAFFDFAPLYARLYGLISPDTVRAVAVQACRGRLLLVGASNYDDGYGYAFDLTRLALWAASHDTPEQMAAVRKAWVGALLASSSVPATAPPVALRFVDVGPMHALTATADIDFAAPRPPQLFLDGGAIAGVFLPRTRDDRHVMLIVNTSLGISPASGNKAGSPAPKWWIGGYALHVANDMLQSSVYQLSVGRVEDTAKLEHGALDMAYLSNQDDMIPGSTGTIGEDAEAHLYPTARPDDPGTRPCKAWREDVDQKLSPRPIEFNPTYVACLADYGRKRGQGAKPWNFTFAAPATDPVPVAGAKTRTDLSDHAGADHAGAVHAETKP